MVPNLNRQSFPQDATGDGAGRGSGECKRFLDWGVTSVLPLNSTFFNYQLLPLASSTKPQALKPYRINFFLANYSPPVAKALSSLKRPTHLEESKHLPLSPFRDAKNLGPSTTQNSSALDLRLLCKARLCSFSLSILWHFLPHPSIMYRKTQTTHAEVPKHGNNDIYSKYHPSTMFRGYNEIMCINTICKLLNRPRFYGS